MSAKKRILLVKPPDRFLENEFVYPQLGPHYLQSYLSQNGIVADILVLYVNRTKSSTLDSMSSTDMDLSDLRMLLLKQDDSHIETDFEHRILGDYDVIGLSVMTPQAPDAYRLIKLVKQHYPHITTVIGGSHPRYYQKQVVGLPNEISFDFVVPQDGWEPMLGIATGKVARKSSSIVLSSTLPKLTKLPPPTRPIALMEKYDFHISGAPAYHTITALGCPFTCHFCESGIEKVRMFSQEMVEADLKEISHAHTSLDHQTKGLMFFDDVGLMSPKQVDRLSVIVNKHGFDTWRAFTHAYLVVKHRDLLLRPFINSGGRRIGIGLETGSQHSLDLINKRNGKKQFVEEHYEAVSIANSLGIAVDGFTMIYPWEDEKDLDATNKLIEFIANNPVKGVDGEGRSIYNHVDATIMSPYQGTKFYDMINLGVIPDVEIDPTEDPGNFYYKGKSGGSGWPYKKTRLPRSHYIAAQDYRNSLRPDYR